MGTSMETGLFTTVYSLNLLRRSCLDYIHADFTEKTLCYIELNKVLLSAVGEWAVKPKAAPKYKLY